MEKISNQEAANRELKSDLLWSVQEIKALREQVKILSIKARAFEALEIALGQGQNQGEAYCIDIVHRLNDRIDRMDNPEPVAQQEV